MRSSRPETSLVHLYASTYEIPHLLHPPHAPHSSSAKVMPSTPTTSRNNGAGAGTINGSTSHAWNIARQPGSVIAFATFDPGTATGDHHVHAFRKLSLNEELCRPKRIVIETTPDGKSTWRFVPKAPWEEGVENEGIWPRLVDICGEKRVLSQDDWDMFKLDQRYDCTVRKLPALSTVQISPRQPPISPSEQDPNSIESPADMVNAKLKRRLSGNSPTISRRPSGGSSDGQKRKARKVMDVFSSSEEDAEEVNEMIIDDGYLPRGKAYLQSERLKKARENKEEARRKRREWTAKWREKNGLLAVVDEDEDMMSWSESHPSPKRPPHRAHTVGTETPIFKRKATLESEDDLDDSSDDGRTPMGRFKSYVPNGKQKRTRTMSPGAAARELKQRRAVRGKKRQEEKALRAQKRAEARQNALLSALMAEHPGSRSNEGHSNGTSGTSTSPSSGPQTPDEAMGDPGEAERQARLEESRRKIAELEKDRPLWEEQARRRAAQEAEERRQAEQRKSKHAENNEAAKEREKQRAKELAEENARREREAAANQTRTKRLRARDASRRDAQTWTSRGWNAAIALERYKHLSEAFDKLNFFKGDVVVFECIPWPVLHRPLQFGVEDIDWSAVEAFFTQVKRYLPATEYRSLVEKSHKRFHPDRWRSRRVLQCVDDEEEKECLEVAANTVAQALTPLWQELTGRS